MVREWSHLKKLLKCSFFSPKYISEWGQILFIDLISWFKIHNPHFKENKRYSGAKYEWPWQGTQAWVANKIPCFNMVTVLCFYSNSERVKIINQVTFQSSYFSDALVYASGSQVPTNWVSLCCRLQMLSDDIPRLWVMETTGLVCTLCKYWPSNREDIMPCTEVGNSYLESWR